MKIKLTLFHSSKALESQLEEFFQKLIESALIYKMAVAVYMQEGGGDEFEARLEQLCEFESRNDTLRRAIESQLYLQTLIPDARGDVLSLLEQLDRLHGMLEGGLYSFSIEQPHIPDQFKTLYLQLVDAVVESVDQLVQASRAFFKDVAAIDHHLHKVMFFETEADKLGTKLKRAIYASQLELSVKAQLKGFAEYIDDVADCAEDIADSLSIFAIKRAI